MADSKTTSRWLNATVPTIDQRNTALSRPDPICYCFAHTIIDLAINLEMNQGTSTITRAIRRSTADRRCAYEHPNPAGRCCLADVSATIATIKQVTML